jgi:copper chaperone NosL
MKNLFVLLMLCLIACSKDAVPIHFGEDICSHCKMIISDQRYGGELLTAKAKPYKFDSIECMAAYILKENEGSENIYSLWTIDFNKPEKLINADQAWYLLSNSLKSPMGLNLSSCLTHDNAESLKNLYGGEIMHWAAIKEVVREKWLSD